MLYAILGLALTFINDTRYAQFAANQTLMEDFLEAPVAPARYEINFQELNVARMVRLVGKYNGAVNV
jgi:hypothetical protein